MKNSITAFALLVGALTVTASAQATTSSVIQPAADVNTVITQIVMNAPQTLNLINWKVGDMMSYEVVLGGFPLGTSVKTLSKDEGTAVWLTQDTKMMGQKDLTELLINKADGKVLKMIRNGKEEQMPESDLEIIEQDEAEITVKAGTFQTIYILAKSKDVEKIELWINPRDAALDGMIKMGMSSQMGPISLSLTSFKRN